VGQLTVSGVSGQVRWGYLTAAVFGAWHFDGEGARGTITTSQLLDAHEMYLTQIPLVVAVAMGRATWRWKVESLTRSGNTLSMQVSRL
jgi:hypothetical protein